MEKRISALLCAVTVFLGAFLLFQVQPLASKAILPVFGGTSAVWTTCMLVFQWLLFAGYCYSHWLCNCLSPRRQAAIHIAVLSLSLLLLFSFGLEFAAGARFDQPVLQIAKILLQTIGFPFFVLSTTGPLVQDWWSRIVRNESPLRLYALSNFASLLALFSFPFFFEPNFNIQEQSRIWSGGFIFYVVSCGLLAIVLAKSKLRDPTLNDLPEKSLKGKSAPAAKGFAWLSRDVAIWFLLGFVPSLMLLATTQQLCLDMAAVPFLWISQLSLYLFSFIVCFSHSRLRTHKFWSVAFLVSASGMVVLLGRPDFPIWIQAAVFSCGLLSCSMLCHGELARLAPAPERLTLFYLVISAAGAAGGTFAGLVAPLVFNSLVELPLAIFTTCLMMLGQLRWDPATFQTVRTKKFYESALSLGVCGIFIGLVWIANSLDGTQLESSRTFYGVLHVVECDVGNSLAARREFRHGRIVHGLQYLEEERRDLPTIYYQKNTGVGILLRTFEAERPRKIGAIGLGVGTIAAFGNAKDVISFYEIDPEVERLARKYFSFLQDSRATCSTEFGDARVNLDRALQAGRPENFDVLVVDAFSGDAIPMHLLTQEAISIYLENLRPDGILAFHISNRHFDLRLVLAAAATKKNLISHIVNTRGICEWVLLSRNEKSFREDIWRDFPSLAGTKEVVWTDNFGSLAQILRPESFHWQVDTNQKFDALIGKSVAKLTAGDVNGAESGFREAIKINGQEAVAWRHLGNLLRNRQQLADAKECFERVVQLSPTDADAWSVLGQLVSQAEPEKAEEYFCSALRMEPNNPSHHQQLADVLLLLQKREDAVRQLEKALELNPKSQLLRRKLEQAQKTKK